jgi:hypothetical protein
VSGVYFNELMLNRQRLLWALATRRQLERWEPLVAAAVLDGFAGRQSADTDVWSAEIERHLVLVAARNLLRALELPPVSGRRGRRDAAPSSSRLGTCSSTGTRTCPCST